MILIQEKIIEIPQTQKSVMSEQVIPDWIKNNAKWWADGQIDDESFVSGIQFLVANNIIKI